MWRGFGVRVTVRVRVRGRGRGRGRVRGRVRVRVAAAAAYVESRPERAWVPARPKRLSGRGWLKLMHGWPSTIWHSLHRASRSARWSRDSVEIVSRWTRPEFAYWILHAGVSVTEKPEVKLHARCKAEAWFDERWARLTDS